MTYGRNSGFTLTEMLLASGISMLAVIGIVAMFITHARSYTNHKLVREMQQNARFAMDSITRDLHMAGYGLAVRDSDVPLWIPWVTNMTDNPHIEAGATTTDPDTITVAGAFDPPVTQLAAAAPEDSTTLTLQSGGATHFDSYRNRVIYVGRCETARVVSKSGNQITISTDPTTNGKGLRYAYTNGAPIELVQTIVYRCHRETTLFGQEQFLVKDAGSTALPDWQKMLCSHIENLQAGPASYGTWVSVTARTSETLAKHSDGVGDDGYLRTTVTSRIIPRNDTAFGLRN
jgi:hypothetical protein